jgi:hypothetical protein
LKHCHAKQQERQQHWKESLITQSASSVAVIIARGVCCRRQISPENKVLEIIELFKKISKIASEKIHENEQLWIFSYILTKK